MSDNEEIVDNFERKNIKKESSIDEKSVGSKVRPMSAKYKNADQKN